MSARFECGDGVGLMAYVYQDGDLPERERIAAHVATCAACAEEVEALQSARGVLREWTPPEASLGFQVVAAPQTPAPVLRPARWWSQPLPAWGQVAAAAVLFGAGITLGAWQATSAPAATRVVAGPANPAAVSSDDLQALESRLLAEIARRETPAPAAVSNARTASAGAEREALMRQVRGLVNDSEQRMQRELTLRTAELVRDVEAQRRGDLARIERTFGQMEGTNNVQAEQQRQMLNYLMRVSQRPGQ